MAGGRAGWFVGGFLAAPSALYGIFVVSPYVQTMVYSLTDWRGVSARISFVGLRNYRSLAGDDTFWLALRHNLTLLLVLPTATIGLALGLSSLLSAGRQRGGGVRGARWSAGYQVIFFLPQVLSVAILVVLWQAVFRTDRGGLLNGLLIWLGAIEPDQPLLFLSSRSAVLWCVAAVALWSSVGFYVLLFCAAMQSIPREYYEAAMLDGAGRLAVFRAITVPLLWNQIQVAWVFLAIQALDCFALVYAMTPSSGGPDHQSEVVATHLYRTGFVLGRTGYACAIGVTLFLLTLALAALSLRLSRRERVEP